MTEFLSDKVRELVAIAASVACNCEPCLKFHYDAARKTGCSAEEMSAAVEMALKVKQAPPKAMRELAQRLGLTKGA